MKIAIYTLTGESNYGNKLQNFAMQYILQKCGYEVETIRFAKQSYKKLLLKNKVKMLVPSLSRGGKYSRVIRKSLFFEFNKKIHYYKKEIMETLDKEKISRIFEPFDYVIYGSDQIWNTKSANFSDTFLGLYNKSGVNIAVSASFGNDIFDQKYKEDFVEGLSSFKAISVREESGQKIVEQLINKSVDILIDPVLVLEMREWEAIEVKVPIPEKYILVYILGKITDEQKTYVAQLALDLDAEILHANPDSAYGPAEFLYLIHHASIICTTSFHACVLAIIYKKQLRIMPRKDIFTSMTSRIYTLLEICNLYYTETNNYICVTSETMSEEKSMAKIEQERERFYDFINYNIC